MSDIKSKDFSRSRQETGSFCGPCVMQMLVSRLGKQIDQFALSDAYADRKIVMREGIALDGLAKALRKLLPDLQVWQKYNSSFQDIKEMLDRGIPVGFDWQGIFDRDEYGDEYWNLQREWRKKWEEIRGVPQLEGDQGHYCIALEIDPEKGYLRFADPYGHYAGKDRFVALWELEERWWDDKLGKDEHGKVTRVIEERLIFVVTEKDDETPLKVGMERI